MSDGIPCERCRKRRPEAEIYHLNLDADSSTETVCRDCLTPTEADRVVENAREQMKRAQEQYSDTIKRMGILEAQRKGLERMRRVRAAEENLSEDDYISDGPESCLPYLPVIARIVKRGETNT